jgi:hypothetical protein
MIARGRPSEGDGSVSKGYAAYFHYNPTLPRREGPATNTRQQVKLEALDTTRKHKNSHGIQEPL